MDCIYIHWHTHMPFYICVYVYYSGNRIFFLTYFYFEWNKNCSIYRQNASNMINHGILLFHSDVNHRNGRRCLFVEQNFAFLCWGHVWHRHIMCMKNNVSIQYRCDWVIVFFFVFGTKKLVYHISANCFCLSITTYGYCCVVSHAWKYRQNQINFFLNG